MKKYQIIYADPEDRITCRVCGKSFKFLGKHIIKHSLTAVEYKDRFHILRQTSLCSDDYANLKRKELKNRIEVGIIKPRRDLLPQNHWKKGFVFPNAFRENMSRRWLGREISEEHRQAISNAHKGIPDPKRTQEFRQHLREISKERTRARGRFVGAMR